MLNRKFVSDMFQPNPMWNASAVKSLMEKIVHASIMRLGHQSFEKLYDLMVMAFKYQLFSATCPQALMVITNKHLENLKPMTDDPEIILHIHYLQGLVTSASLITACSPFKNKIINEHFLSGSITNNYPRGHGCRSVTFCSITFKTVALEYPYS